MHLGRGFTSLGPAGRTIRQAQFETLKRIVSIVHETDSEFLIIAGDLFDSNSVSEKMVATTFDYLKSLSPTPVYILPGTHDVFDASSVYRSSLLTQGLENVKVFPSEPTEFRPAPEIGVFGSANTSKRGGQRPLAALSSLAENSDAKYKVAVVHGSLLVPIVDSASDEVLIEPAEVQNGPFNYVAAGHWHSRQEWRLGASCFCYAGCPETLGFDNSPSPGAVTLVTLGERVVLEQSPVGKHRWITMAADLGSVSETDVLRKAKEQRDKDGLFRLELRGTPDVPVDIEDIEEKLAQEFLHVTIDSTRLVSSIPVGDQLPENSVIRAFADIMVEKIEAATDPGDKEVLQEALRRGCLYLSGKAAIRS